MAERNNWLSGRLSDMPRFSARTASRCRWHGLLLYRCVFSLFFLIFRHLISEFTKQISTKLGHIFTYEWLLLEKFGPNSPGHLPSRDVGKKRFLGPTLNFDQIYLCSKTRHRQSERNLSICLDSLTCSPNFVNVGPEEVMINLIHAKCPPVL